MGRGKLRCKGHGGVLRSPDIKGCSGGIAGPQTWHVPRPVTEASVPVLDHIPSLCQGWKGSLATPSRSGWGVGNRNMH